MADSMWNPVTDARAKYPGLKGWSDDRILDNLADPARFRSAFPQYAKLGDDVIKRNISSLRSPTTHVAGEGLYQMVGPQGKPADISYSRVNAASKAGYKMTPKSIKTYLADTKADPNLAQGMNLPSGVRVVGRNAAGQPMYAPVNPLEQKEGAASRFAGSLGSTLANTARGMYQGVVAGPQNPEEARIASTSLTGAPLGAQPVTGRARLLAHRFITGPAKEQAGKAAEEFKQAAPTSLHPTTEQLRHRQLAAGHALAAALPGVGPAAAQVGEQIGQQVGTGDIAGAIGTATGNVALYEAPKLAKGAIRPARAAGRNLVESLTKTGPRQLKELAEKTVKANQEAVQKAAEANTKAAQQHLDQTQDALKETGLRETSYEAKVKAKDDVAKAKHDVEVAKVREHNNRVQAKHKAVADRIREENAASEHALEMRRSAETQLEKDTNDYYAKEDQVKAKAKGIENSAWDDWRKKTNASEGDVDMAPVMGVIQEQLTDTPEAANILRKVESQESALDPDAQFYKAHRDEVMKYFGYTGDYENLPTDAMENVDRMMSDGGRFPAGKPVDLTTVSTMPLEQIHSIKSNLGYKRFNRTYAPDVRYAMGKIYNTMDKLEQAESIKRGGGDALSAAKQQTRDYQEAFGKERHAPKTQDDIREKEANPEAYKTRKDQERLNAARKIDPTLVDDYQKVKDAREAIKKLPNEDQLRKAQKQVPPPPSVDDLREGYRLQGEPAPPPPARESVEQPERAPISERPPEVEPERKTVDLQAEKRAEALAMTEQLRNIGVRRAINSLMYTVPTAILSTLLGHPGYALAEIASAPVILAGSQALAGLLERPGVLEWIGKVTEKDVAAFDKLPNEQKAVFAQNLRELVQEANKRKIHLSPAISAFLVSSANTQQKPKTLQELRQEAQQRNPGATQDNTQTPPSVAPPEAEEPAQPAASQDAAAPDQITVDAFQDLP